MENLQLFYIALGVALVLWGISVFVAERTLVVIAGVAAIIAGVLSLALGL